MIDFVNTYPEASLAVAIAQSVWNGSTATARMDFSVLQRLKDEYKRTTGNDLMAVFITDSDIRHNRTNGHGRKGKQETIIQKAYRELFVPCND